MSCGCAQDEHSIWAQRGCQYRERLGYQDKTGAPIPLLGVSATLIVKASEKSDVVLLEKPLPVDEEGGKIDIVVTKTERDTLPEGKYRYAILLVRDGEDPEAFIWGPFVAANKGLQ